MNSIIKAILKALEEKEIVIKIVVNDRGDKT